MLIQFASVREAFGIRMPDWGDVGFVVLIGIGVMVTIEIAKILLRRRAQRMAGRAEPAAHPG